MSQDPAQDEMTVTPEMIEAGMRMLVRYGWTRAGQTLGQAADMLEAIYGSMAANAPRG